MRLYTLTNFLVTIRNDQAKDGQESTFYMTTPPHKCEVVKVVKFFLASENVKVLNHPPYSPDMSPCDFFLFPRLKKMLSGNLFLLRFYGPVSPMGSWRARSVYLTTRLLGRPSPLSG